MKQITFTLTFLLIANFAFELRAQTLFKNLGKGKDEKVVCACINEKNENLTIGYFNETTNQLELEEWDAASSKWTIINNIPSLKFSKNKPKCIYKNDSLIVTTNFIDINSKIKSVLQYVTTTQKTVLAEFKSSNLSGEANITDLKIVKNKLLVLGNFDSVYVNDWKRLNNAVLYDGVNFSNLGYNRFTLNLSNQPAAIINDTLLILTKENIIIKAEVKPSEWFWDIIIEPSQLNIINSISVLDSKWIFTRENNDTIFQYSAGSISKKYSVEKLRAPLNVINLPIGSFVSEQGINGRILKYNSDGSFTSLFISHKFDTTNCQGLISNITGTKTYYISSVPILFENTNYGNVAEINLNLSKPISFDTIALFVFEDVDRNYKWGPGEKMLSSTIFNKTTNLSQFKATGLFSESVPSYNDVDYEVTLTDTVSCFKLPFTGRLRSINTRKNVSKDTIYFPFQKSLDRNIQIKSFAKRQARLLDTIPLYVSISNKDCDKNTYGGFLKITLQSNTTFVNSSPFPTNKKDNVLIYDLKNLSPGINHEIKINIKYTDTFFYIDQIIKHKVSFLSEFAEDTTDNSDSIVQKICYSYDPNRKYCLPEGSIKSDVKSIRYYIDFQNEGNDVARRVTVIDTLQVNIPVYEFEIISCSHPYTVSLSKNVVTWVFDNINLPPKTIDDAASKGFIVFEGHLRNGLEIGDSIKNRAFIYFDYNKPIITNMSILSRSWDDTLVIEKDIQGKNSIIIYPNPANTFVNIENKSINPQDVKIYNMIGQQILSLPLNSKEIVSKSLESWPSGMYFIKSSGGGFKKFLVN
jgi:hypothetical protein